MHIETALINRWDCPNPNTKSINVNWPNRLAH
jgi:hypothetical protein